MFNESRVKFLLNSEEKYGWSTFIWSLVICSLQIVSVTLLIIFFNTSMLFIFGFFLGLTGFFIFLLYLRIRDTKNTVKLLKEELFEKSKDKSIL